MKISNNALNLIKKWEGYSENAYLCPAKVWTIGYGTTKYANGKAVKKGDKINQSEALKLLEKQVNEHASTIYQYVKVELNQNQYDALASFQYNLGKYILKNSSLLNYINTKQWSKASNEMMKYVKASGKVLQGLVNRRKEEVALFMKPIEIKFNKSIEPSKPERVIKLIKDCTSPTLQNEFIKSLEIAYEKKVISDKKWLEQAQDGSMKLADAILLMNYINKKLN